MGKFRNFIDSFFQGNDVPPNREELMRRLDAIEEELRNEHSIAEQYKEDSQRLFTKNEQLEARIKKLEAENKQLKDQADQSEAKRAELEKDFESFVTNSMVISERLKKVAFGKKSEKFDKAIGKQTRRYVDSYFNIVDDACGRLGLTAGQPAARPNGASGQPSGPAAQPKPGQQVLGPNGQPLPGRTGSSGSQNQPSQTILGPNGQPMTGQTGNPATQTKTGSKGGNTKKTSPPVQNKTGGKEGPVPIGTDGQTPGSKATMANGQRLIPILGADGKPLPGQIAVGSAQASPPLFVGTDGNPLPGQKALASVQGQPILILGPDGQPLPGQKAGPKGTPPSPPILGADGRPLPGQKQIPQNRQPIEIIGCDGRPIPIPPRKHKVRRKEGFLHTYTTNKYVYGFMDYGRTAYDYMDYYDVGYDEQRLWLIAHHLLSTPDLREVAAAEAYRDKYFGYLRSRSDAYPILDYAGGRYFEKICIVPEATHGGDTLAGRRISRLLRSSAASPAVIAHHAMLKYRQGLPENAIAQMAKAEGANLDRSTISSWLIEAYRDYFWAVHWYLRQKCLERSVLLMDETYGHFLENLEQFTCYLWGMCTSPLDRDGMKIKFYYFDRTRYGLVADYLLHGFVGMLVADGFDGYGWLNKINEDIDLCSDWVHPRRKFMEVLPSKKIQEQMSEEELRAFKALTILACISRMFALEQEYAELSADERLFLRQGELKTCYETVISTCKEMAAEKDFDVHSELGTAVQYILDREETLGKMLEDGNITLSTNEIERSNIIVALVRKRAFQFGSMDGAQAACGFFSCIETAEANDVNAEDFLEFILTCLPYVFEEHENELNAFKEYLDRVEKAFEEAKEKHRKNPKADVRIDWATVGKEPSLDFLDEVMFDTEGFAAFQAMKKERNAFLTQKLLDGLNEWEFSHSSVSRAGMKMMLNSPSSMENPILNGARSFLAGLPEMSTDDPSQQRYYNGIIKNLFIPECSYPQLFVVEAKERGLEIDFPTIKKRAFAATPSVARQFPDTAGNPITGPHSGPATAVPPGDGTPEMQGVPSSGGANMPPPTYGRAGPHCGAPVPQPA